MPLQPADLQGRYINLDRAGERRRQMERSIARHGLGEIVTRFAAREGDNRPRGITRNELGCFLSHQEVIATADPDRPLLIFEDDVHFTPRSGALLASIFPRLCAQSWDMIFLTKIVSYASLGALSRMLQLKRQAGDIHAPSFSSFSLEPCRALYFWGTAAYLIHPAALPKLGAILARAAADGYRRPIDIVYQEAIRRQEIDASFLFPYLFGIDPNLPASIDDRSAETDAVLISDMVNLFVAGGDITPLRTRAFDTQREESFDVDAFIASQLIYRRLSQPS